jgi:DNA-directed RNA polymerase specialized sigma24 family protein
MGDSPASLDDLLTKARQGNLQALQTVLVRCRPKLKIIARAHLRARPIKQLVDSNDLAQSTFRVLWKGFGTGRFAFTGLPQLLKLAQIIISRKVHNLRRNNRVHRYVAAGPEQVLDAVTCPQPTPALAALQEDTWQYILKQLQHMDRQILVDYLEGRSVLEAAQGLGLTEYAYRMRRSRLFQKLRQDDQVRSELNLDE